LGRSPELHEEFDLTVALVIVQVEESCTPKIVVRSMKYNKKSYKRDKTKGSSNGTSSKKSIFKPKSKKGGVQASSPHWTHQVQ
jgi:hypothetical protein